MWIPFLATILPTNTHTHHIAYPLPDRAIPTSTPVQSNLTLVEHFLCRQTSDNLTEGRNNF